MSTQQTGPDHHRIEADDWNRIYVVGDVHGCLSELETLVEALSPTGEDLVVFVGDLVRKGPDSAGVLAFVRERENFRSVRSNNEQKLLDGEKDLSGLDEADLDYLETLPLTISWEGALVAHAGVDPRKALADQTADDFLEFRSLDPAGSYDRPFWFERYEGPPTVFFGHTVLAEPVDREHAVGLDTGCVYGNALTAYDWHDERFLSVPVERPLVDRSESKIVTPIHPPDPDDVRAR
ncbi:MAG: metallophosphoesterase family protein [Halalkalicoccus sp.]